MFYVTSDLHGIPLDDFKLLLSKVNFSDDDFLFILGDVIDRGENSIELLQFIMKQPNMELLLGNHEAMMLSCSFLLDEITDETVNKFDNEKLQIFTNWISNGASHTINELRSLNNKSPEAVLDIFEFLREAPLYEAITLNDKDFIFTHSGFENFSRNKKISEYCEHELIWNRPKLTDRYFDDIITVFGHTPTGYIDEKYRGKIIKTDTWIDIDTSLTTGSYPCLLRLDDLQAFYISD